MMYKSPITKVEMKCRIVQDSATKALASVVFLDANDNEVGDVSHIDKNNLFPIKEL